MRLENFIKNNRDAFDGEEPSAGHFERFEKRLKGNRIKRYRIWTGFLAAAVMVGVILSVVFLERPETCKLKGEMRDVQKYYGSKLNLEMEHLEKVLKEVDPSVRADVMSDLLQIEGSPESLPDDFCKELGNEKVKAIVIDYYQTKIKTVQTMITFFEEKDRNVI